MLDGQNPVIAEIYLIEAIQAPVNATAAESIINNPLKPLHQKYEEIGSEIWVCFVYDWNWDGY